MSHNAILLSAKQTLHGSSHYPSMVKEYSLSRVNTINTAMPAYSNTQLGCITAWLYNHKADGTDSPSSDGTGS